MQTSFLIRNLFNSFHENDIIYCHWKSNEHLDASFKGDTDFDVLFDSSQKVIIQEIFNKNGFALFTPPYNRRYREIVDFIAIDYDQNRVIHFHTHYQLRIGASGLKEYRYAIENRVFRTRVFCPDYECYLIDPAHELILLLLRLSLKVRKDWESNFQNNKEIINSNRELDWLRERVSFEHLSELLKDLDIPYDKDDVLNIYQNNFQYKSLFALSLQSEKIRDLEKDSYIVQVGETHSKWIYFQYGRLARKSGASYVTKQRVKKNDGFSIAILGSDGSGKSTQLVELRKILSKKIDVETFYLGSNKGSKSQIRKILEYIRERNLTLNVKPFEQILTIFHAFSIAFEKHLRLKKAHKLKRKGVLVLFDRFPQNQTYGYNDGPILKRLATSKNIFLKSIGRWEEKLYTPNDSRYPDMFIKLIADPEILSNRRDMTIEEVNDKQNSILELNFGNKSQIIQIDATQSIERVTSDVLKAIQHWLN